MPKSAREVPSITLHRKGAISLNRAAAEALGWQPRSHKLFLSLAWNKPVLTIAPAERGLSLNVYRRHSNYYAFVFSAKPFLRQHSLLLRSTRRFTPITHGFSLFLRPGARQGVPCCRPSATRPRRRFSSFRNPGDRTPGLYASYFRAAVYFHPLVYWKHDSGQIDWVFVDEREFHLDDATATQAAADLVHQHQDDLSTSENLHQALMAQGLVPLNIASWVDDPAALISAVQFSEVEKQIVEGSPPIARAAFADFVHHGVPPRVAIRTIADVFWDCLSRGRLDTASYEIRLTSLLAANAFASVVH